MPAKDFGSQRSAYKSRSFVEYCQANARRQVEMAYEDGLLRPNAGMPCFCSGCDGLLGPLCGDPDDFELQSRNVYNRCGISIKQYVPRELAADNDVCLELCVREGQWHFFVKLGHEWQSFCAASLDYRASLEADADAFIEGRADPESLPGRVHQRLSKMMK